MGLKFRGSVILKEQLRYLLGHRAAPFQIPIHIAPHVYYLTENSSMINVVVILPQ